jgi:RNA polymerase sigma-70 factor (ECF subfamily)
MEDAGERIKVDEHEYMAERFQEHRSHLRAVAYRMLGSLTEADDAVQEAWLRLSRVGSSDIDNLGGWLTTVVGRVCLDVLRARRLRREHPLDAVSHLPDPLVSPEQAGDPEAQALIADSVGLALLVVLESLSPAERLAFVLHDIFDMPFEEIAPIVGRTAATARKLASRSRRKVRGAIPNPEPDLTVQRRVVDAFLAAARNGDFHGLLAILDPKVVLRADDGIAPGGGMKVVRGAQAAASQVDTFQKMATTAVSHPVLVNGLAGLVNTIDDKSISIMSFTIVGEKIVAIDILSDPERLASFDLSLITPRLSCDADQDQTRSGRN